MGHGRDETGQDELRLIIALVRKLGGEVTLTTSDLEGAEGMELQRMTPDDFSGGMSLRARHAPVTIEGSLATEGGSLTRG
jgi:hypothetical protein